MSTALTLHAVVYSKDRYSLAQAKESVKQFIPKTRTFYRETDKTYRFRNVPKQRFVPKSFRTKKVSDGLSLVFGVLRNETLTGTGIIDTVSSAVSKVKEWIVPDTFNRHSADTLKKYGSRTITRLDIYRTPIQTFVKTALDVLSLGAFSKAVRQSGYDSVFHVALIAQVGDRHVVLEKIEAVNIDTSYPTSHNTQIFNVKMGTESFTLNTLVRRGRYQAGDKTFFRYSAFGQGQATNCQGFVRLLLQGVNLYTEEVASFLYQDVEKIVQSLPGFLPKVAKAITDTAGIVSYLRGDGQGTHRERVIQYFGVPDKGYSLQELALLSGVPQEILERVEARGYGAYTTNYQSVREKGTYRKGRNVPPAQKLSPSQWARSRTYSFLSSLIDGKPRHDFDLFSMVQ